jgi:hypothetical protein
VLADKTSPRQVEMARACSRGEILIISANYSRILEITTRDAGITKLKKTATKEKKHTSFSSNSAYTFPL